MNGGHPLAQLLGRLSQPGHYFFLTTGGSFEGPADTFSFGQAGQAVRSPGAQTVTNRVVADRKQSRQLTNARAPVMLAHGLRPPPHPRMWATSRRCFKRCHFSSGQGKQSKEHAREIDEYRHMTTYALLLNALLFAIGR